jgi:hypothetical protein
MGSRVTLAALEMLLELVVVVDEALVDEVDVLVEVGVNDDELVEVGVDDELVIGKLLEVEIDEALVTALVIDTCKLELRSSAMTQLLKISVSKIKVNRFIIQGKERSSVQLLA